MRHIKIYETYQSDVMVKITAYNDFMAKAEAIKKDIGEIQKEQKKIIVQLLDIIGKRFINIDAPCTDKTYYKIENNPSDQSNRPLSIHEGGGDCILYFRYSPNVALFKKKKSNTESLWNLCINNREVAENEDIAAILDAIIKKYPDAMKKLNINKTGGRFGL